MNALSPSAHTLIGTVRRFGPYGPVYQVTGIGPVSAAGQQTMLIHILESGEDTDYKLEDVSGDPIAD